jgi:hypothetical protein
MMKIKKLLKEIKGVFKPPIKRYYLGKLAMGTPYMWPLGFNKNIITIRILKLRDPDKYNEYIKDYPHLKDTHEAKFSNFPMCRRSKDWVFKIFGKDIWLQIGWPFVIVTTQLGWKDKWSSPRFEFPPAFQIDFFHWQFFTWWQSPDKNDDRYYEMILWWLYYSNKDIEKAKKTWPWTSYPEKISTWNEKYLI